MERTIDQRLDALTASVELLASIYSDRERVFYDSMREQHEFNKLIVAELKATGAALTLMASSQAKLTDIAEYHEGLFRKQNKIDGDTPISELRP